MNKKLFKTSPNTVASKTEARLTVNEAGGKAYSMSSKHALAQMACTGFFGNTYYASAETQLEKFKTLLTEVDPSFVLRAATYARKAGFMKDSPAIMLGYVFSLLPTLEKGDARQKAVARELAGMFPAAFNTVIDNAKMLSNFVQVIRSNTFGRKSFGTMGKTLIQNWLVGRNWKKLFKESAGITPSIQDIIKMVHPKGTSENQSALFGYLAGVKYNPEYLPEFVQHYIAYQNATPEGREKMELPEADFRQLTSLNLTPKIWTKIAAHAPWHMTRMNLNTFVRHGVFSEDPSMVKTIANRLADEDLVKKSKVFPYQLFQAYKSATYIPAELSVGLQKAMEIAIENTPELSGNVVIGIDTSGSMSSLVSDKSTVRCLDVAALFGAAVYRKNPNAKLVPFDRRAHDVGKVNPLTPVVDLAQTLSKFGGGGTNCSIPLQEAMKMPSVDAVIIISDNESWAVSRTTGLRGTESNSYWQQLKKKNPNAKLVLIDIQPYTSTQVLDDKSVLNVGGFSDAVFGVVSSFLDGKTSGEHWVDVIEKYDPSTSVAVEQTESKEENA